MSKLSEIRVAVEMNIHTVTVSSDGLTGAIKELRGEQRYMTIGEIDIVLSHIDELELAINSFKTRLNKRVESLVS